jgi:hypothetical protein
MRWILALGAPQLQAASHTRLPPSPFAEYSPLLKIASVRFAFFPHVCADQRCGNLCVSASDTQAPRRQAPTESFYPGPRLEAVSQMVLVGRGFRSCGKAPKLSSRGPGLPEGSVFSCQLRKSRTLGSLGMTTKLIFSATCPAAMSTQLNNKDSSGLVRTRLWFM